MQPERRFTIGMLEWRRLSISDILILLIFFLIIILAVPGWLISYYGTKGACLLGGLMIGLETVMSPLGLRFRSVFFSILWLLMSLSLIFMWPDLSSAMPLVTFALYHVLRLLFWKKYNRELIPFDFYHNTYTRFYSKIERTSSGVKDKRYMRILVWSGFTIFLICLFAGINEFY
jgi:hypothetical protein